MSGTRKTVLIILGIFGALILVAAIGIAILWTSLPRLDWIANDTFRKVISDMAAIP